MKKLLVAALAIACAVTAKADVLYSEGDCTINWSPRIGYYKSCPDYEPVYYGFEWSPGITFRHRHWRGYEGFRHEWRHDEEHSHRH